ncbi:MAG TPA: hypothetical protein VKB86_04000 [Pyrinomonadaceae bacterium]|nr:hypothetical protein [Pyrinomonadaceae bacterium]
MTEQDKRNEPESESSSSENQTNDPGRTPGTAEGDRQTVEEDLRGKESSE